MTRYAIYHCPDGAQGDWGAGWLGWDIRSGETHPPARPELVKRPSKYGFHATLKAPFRLAEARGETGLKEAVARLAQGLAPVSFALDVQRIGSFFALVPQRRSEELELLAAACVEELDGYRAPLTEAELARRNPARLSPHQAALLSRWGYPYVMDEFRFHITLTGPVAKDDVERVAADVTREAASVTGAHRLDSICLCGERDDGRFELIERFALG